MKFFDTFFKKKSLSQVAREEGYVTDQKGIQNRFVREREHWQLHLDNTKQYILQSAKRSASKKSVAVLGSGWLLDVPVAELAQEFEEVYLYDIVHPEQIVVNMRKYPNVHLVVADLTDGAVELAAQSHSFEEFCNSLAHISLTPNLQQFDFVVSVNLLNQLDIILCDYLKEKFSITESELIEIRKKDDKQLAKIGKQNILKKMLGTVYNKLIGTKKFKKEFINLINKKIFDIKNSKLPELEKKINTKIAEKNEKMKETLDKKIKQKEELLAEKKEKMPKENKKEQKFEGKKFEGEEPEQ